MNEVGKNIAEKFREFINSQEYDPYEIAIVCKQVLDENRIVSNGSSQHIGVVLFEEEEEYNDCTGDRKFHIIASTNFSSTSRNYI